MTLSAVAATLTLAFHTVRGSRDRLVGEDQAAQRTLSLNYHLFACSFGGGTCVLTHVQRVDVGELGSAVPHLVQAGVGPAVVLLRGLGRQQPDPDRGLGLDRPLQRHPAHPKLLGRHDRLLDGVRAVGLGPRRREPRARHRPADNRASNNWRLHGPGADHVGVCGRFDLASDRPFPRCVALCALRCRSWGPLGVALPGTSPDVHRCVLSTTSGMSSSTGSSATAT